MSGSSSELSPESCIDILDYDEHSSSSSESKEDVVDGCYGCEPEYTEEESKHLHLQKLKDSSEESDDLESSGLKNLHWCRCHECVIGLTFTVEECKCCKEFNLLREKLEGLTCITKHPDFNNLMLNPSVLKYHSYDNKT